MAGRRGVDTTILATDCKSVYDDFTKEGTGKSKDKRMAIDVGSAEGDRDDEFRDFAQD